MKSTEADRPIEKTFPVFDCDAHINDPVEIWTEYVEPEYRERVKQSCWNPGGGSALLNGQLTVEGGHSFKAAARINPIALRGPGVNQRIQRYLRLRTLDPQQVEYLDHKGAYDPHARVRDLDLMGIDQVLIIPTMLVNAFPFIRDAVGAYGLARAYNNWVHDWCRAVPERLFPAALLPLQNAEFAVKETQRVAKMGFRVVLVRPLDANGAYPNRILPPRERSHGAGPFGVLLDPLLRTIEEAGVVLGMHTFPAPLALGIDPGPTAFSPGDYVERAGRGSGTNVISSTFSFVLESMTWLSQVLLSGLLDRYPRLKMAIFESNATWLPSLLEHLDRLFKLYARERRTPASRLPSEAFYAQCIIAFESDEGAVYRQCEQFENIGVWSSDAYHVDAAEAWEAIRHMRAEGVPAAVQEKLLGGNARRLYGIEGKLFTTHEPAQLERPEWFPREDASFAAWWDRESHPRRLASAPASEDKGGN